MNKWVFDELYNYIFVEPIKKVGLFFWQTVIFLFLIWLLKKYASTPILNTINEREEGIKNALESAEKAREEIKTLNASNDKVLR